MMKLKTLKLKDLKPATKQDKFLEFITKNPTPDRKYENMDKTKYQVKGTHSFFKWETENWN